MKTPLRILLTTFFVAISLQAYAQGVMVYDQQSATGLVSTFKNGVDGFDIQPQSLTQSFTPTLSAIGFVQFEFIDPPNNGNNGATVYVNLWTGSPNVNSATLLASTTPVYMPNGFENNNLGLAGVATFDFSTPVALNTGQTYYLQPVVQSGDNPWAIIVIGDTYASGQLYGNGSFFQPGTDLWFREGAVVPEPTTLVLLFLGGLFVLARRPCRNLLLIAGLSLTTLASAQTYYLQSYGGVGSLPLPFNPLGSSVPVYEVSTGVYLVEDGAPSFGRFHAMTDISGPPSLGSTNGSGTNIFEPSDFVAPVFTNGLWLQALNTNGTTTNFVVRAHNTLSGNNVQLLSTSSLPSTNWELGQILSSTNDSFMDFSPVTTTNPMTFYRVHYANPIMKISAGQAATEPNPTNSDPGVPGNVRIQNEGPTTNIITVYYSISGTAQNGVDYSNITGSVTFAAGQSESDVAIAPIADALKICVANFRRKA